VNTEPAVTLDNSDPDGNQQNGLIE